MRIHVTILLASICSLVLLLPPTGADEPAQIKEKVEALTREAKQLKEAGKHDEAKAVQEKVEALIREVKGREGERRDTPAIGRESLQRAEQEIAKRREQAADLRKAGKVEEAEKIEQEAKAMAEKLGRAVEEFKKQAAARERTERDQPRDRPASREGVEARDRPPARERAEHARGEGVEQRVKHLLEAAEHLAAAGKGDLADQLRREAQALRQGREVERPRGDRPREGAAREGGPRDAGPSRDELHELRQGMQRMHAEMEELRNLVRRLAERREER